MKLPFVSEVPEFKPRRHLGVPEDISPQQRTLLEFVDVMEQKTDYAMGKAIAAYNGMLILIAVVLLINGTAVLGIVQKWLMK